MKQEKVLKYYRKENSSDPKELEQQKARAELFALDGGNEISEAEDGEEGAHCAGKKLSEDVENGKVSQIVVESRDRLPEDCEIPSSYEFIGQKRAWLYSRVGSESQKEFLDAHLRILTEYANREGFLIAGVTMEAGPAVPDREGLDEILHAAENGEMDYVLIIEYSRLFRGDLDSGLEYLDKLDALGVQVLCLDENDRKLMEKIKEERNTVSGKFFKELSEELRKTESKWEAEEELEDTEKNGLLE